MKSFLLILAGLALMSTAVGDGKTWSGTAFHVDAENGLDSNDGLTPETAWRTLSKVNGSVQLVRPGDAVLFRRGCMWRGVLEVASGEPGRPTYYGAYGKGPKPILQGSVCRGRPEDWVKIGPGLWSTREFKAETTGVVRKAKEIVNFRCTAEHGFEASGEVLSNDADGEFFRLRCRKVPEGPQRFYHLQLWGAGLDGVSLPLLLRFRTRGGFRPTKAEVVQERAPFACLSVGRIDYAEEQGADGWTEARVLLNDADKKRVAGGSLHFYLGEEAKKGESCDLKFVSLESVKPDSACVIGKDVGNVLFGGEETWGFKKWGLGGLKDDLDYWYDETRDRVVVKSADNPAEVYGPVELCKTWTIVSHAKRHDVTVEALTIRYTSGFAFAGHGAENFTVRNCDMYFIGGGLQCYRKEKDGSLVPVRYGNGIEYWGNAKNCLVERCRLWQIYDAALTPQFSGGENLFDGIVFRDNVIWQAEYSYEFWNHSRSGRTYNVIFDHNTCVDAGYCWSHSQRPLKHAAHLMAFDHYGAMSNQVIRNCLFVRSAERDLHYYNRWQKDLSIDYNMYFEPLNTLCESHTTREDRDAGRGPWFFAAGPKEFARYRRVCGDERHSIYAAPRFVNERRRDYRLVPGSPGTKAASDGSDMGARDMPGLDEDQSVGASLRARQIGR